MVIMLIKKQEIYHIVSNLITHRTLFLLPVNDWPFEIFQDAAILYFGPTGSIAPFDLPTSKTLPQNQT